MVYNKYGCDLMKEKANFFQRGMAILIDVFIVGVIVSIISAGFSTNKVDKLNKELTNLMDEYTSGEIDSIKYIDEYVDIMYDMNKANFNSNLVYLVVCIGYFLIFQYLNEGASIGKKLLRIRIVSNDGKNVNFIQMFIRTSIINEILPMAMMIILIMVSSGKVFFAFYGLINLIENLFIIICVFMVLYRKDKLALHDMMSKSMVIREDV